MSETTNSKNDYNNKSEQGNCLNLDAPGVAEQVAKRIKDDIDAYCQAAYSEGFRNHLGGSVIGNSCARYSWLIFRWCNNKKTSARMLRLFDRGKKEESRFIEWLKGIGFDVNDSTEDGKQHRINGIGGHFGGSLDSILKPPSHYGLDCVFIGEYKTSGTGKKFNDLKKNGVKVEKPQHYGQMSLYGKNYGFQWAIYLCINKNDDDIYVEVVKLDWLLAAELEMKAQEIILSMEPPPRLAETAAYFECKHCDFVGICHNSELPAKNCRSCKHSKPVENAEWSCEKFNAIIPADFISKSCEQYKAIINV